MQASAEVVAGRHMSSAAQETKGRAVIHIRGVQKFVMRRTQKLCNLLDASSVIRKPYRAKPPFYSCRRLIQVKMVRFDREGNDDGYTLRRCNAFGQVHKSIALGGEIHSQHRVSALKPSTEQLGI